MNKFSEKELEYLIEFLGCQNKSDTNNIIEKYQLNLDGKEIEKIMFKLYLTLSKLGGNE